MARELDELMDVIIENCGNSSAKKKAEKIKEMDGLLDYEDLYGYNYYCFQRVNKLLEEIKYWRGETAKAVRAELHEIMRETFGRH